MLKLTSIVDNTCLRHSYLAQHGQSILIQDDDQNILFDTGEIFRGLETNLNNLKFDLTTLSSIVISHQHLDHCGALPELISHLTKPVQLYIPEPLFTPESLTAQNKYYNLEISNVPSTSNYPITHLVSPTGLQLSEHIYLTGPVDGAVKEQAVIIKLNSTDIAVIVGCSHPSIQSLIDQSLKVTKASRVIGVVGGMHFKDMSPSEIDNQVNYLASLNLNFLVPSHCTGNRATEALRTKMPEQVKTSEAGSFGVGNSIQLLPDLNFDI